MAARPARAVTPLEMAVAERNAVALGISLDALMENAGRAVAEEAARHLPAPPARVAIVAGPGNNGGDGLCAAFYLGQWGYSPEIWLVRPASEIRSSAARRGFERIAHRWPMRLHPPTGPALSDFPLIVDAVLGTGQSSGLRPPFDEAARAMNDSGRPILAVDVPTGFGTAGSVRARWTVALTAPKAGVSPTESGEVVVRGIGLPEEALTRTGPGEFLRFPSPGRGPRGRDARVLVVGGGPYAGAPALAALAALRSGAERATVAAPTPASEHIQGFSPNLVVVPLSAELLRPDDVPALLTLVERTSVRSLVVGMGLGTDPRTLEAVRQLLRDLDGRLPVCLDADALGAFSPNSSEGRPGGNSPCVGTPNSGEFGRYFGGTTEGTVEERLARAGTVARGLGLTLLVKGDADLITDGEDSVVNVHHHPAMTVSGVGDILAGVTGSLLAQGLTAHSAARLAAYWVGEAGHRAARSRGFGLIATDLLEELPFALVEGLRRVRDAV